MQSDHSLYWALIKIFAANSVWLVGLTKFGPLTQNGMKPALANGINDSISLIRLRSAFRFSGCPVNSISGQTEGQNGISIAEMDSLGSITYI